MRVKLIADRHCRWIWVHSRGAVSLVALEPSLHLIRLEDPRRSGPCARSFSS
ncbi:hypothetical protein [Microvirga sp. M2]|uniref:hypothetical protein n=1 Tax=Microvirga sp. M2 TaxID=3073270 RepID=UPI0039C1C681